jgi:hypothetical protein
MVWTTGGFQLSIIEWQHITSVRYLNGTHESLGKPHSFATCGSWKDTSASPLANADLSMTNLHPHTGTSHRNIYIRAPVQPSLGI